MNERVDAYPTSEQAVGLYWTASSCRLSFCRIQGESMRLKFLVACIAFCPMLVSASEPVRIQPSSKWVLDYADNSCRLIRLFGEGGNQTKLAFEGVAPNEITMLIVGGTLRSSIGQGEVKARFLPGTDEPFTGIAGEADHGAKGAALWTSLPLDPTWKRDDRKFRFDATIRQNIDLVEHEAARAKRTALATSTTELSVAPSSGRAMVLETGSLGKPIAMFDECERDLLRQWGVDPDVQDKIFKPVWAPNVLSWFSANDYPTAELANSQSSVVNVRLAVDATGKVTKCVSLSAFNAPAFNKVVCNVYLARARFFPAELANGTKVPSYYSQHITFKVP